MHAGIVRALDKPLERHGRLLTGEETQVSVVHEGQQVFELEPEPLSVEELIKESLEVLEERN